MWVYIGIPLFFGKLLFVLDRLTALRTCHELPRKPIQTSCERSCLKRILGSKVVWESPYGALLPEIRVHNALVHANSLCSEAFSAPSLNPQP